MQRTISTMIGKCSVNHNSQKFKAENADADRSHLNLVHRIISNQPYHLPDFAYTSLSSVNDATASPPSSALSMQKSFCVIWLETYFSVYQIIAMRTLKKFTTNCLAKRLKDTTPSRRGKTERQKTIIKNPQLRLFSAHLHLGKAAPHLHIDFVPFTMGRKRGLDT